jgi:ubiquitin-associated and SH3 domain-containing protein
MQKATSISSAVKSKRAVIVRHGERVDFIFGYSWTQDNFDDKGNYVRKNLNLPKSLPIRKVDAWVQDVPLTSLGQFQAQLVGSSFKDHQVNFTKIFVSPAYRCLQTAKGILTSMGIEEELPLNVEYGLFEYLGWYGGNLPNWFSKKEMSENFNIDQNYKPIMSRSQLEDAGSLLSSESVNSFYNRSSSTMKEILKNLEGDILVVTHAPNLDTCTRQLIQKPPRSHGEFDYLSEMLPYCAVIALEQKSESTFQLVDPPCLTLTHGKNSDFNWRRLIEK